MVGYIKNKDESIKIEAQKPLENFMEQTKKQIFKDMGIEIKTKEGGTPYDD